MAARDENLVARFVREARIAAQLRHRHIARVEDFGTTPDGRPFLVMELLKGESLEERLQAQGAIPSGMSPADFAKFIAAETKKWATVVKASGATVD